MLVGAFISRKSLLPKFIDEKMSTLQNIALCILLAAMGFAIGSDKQILSNIHLLGLKSFVVALFAVIFSIFFVKIIYRGDK